MNAEKSLTELGLSPQESIVYVALLKSGEAPASLLAKEVAMQRTTAYTILKELVTKGFAIAYQKRGRQVFVAEKPQNVAGYFEKKLKSFTEHIPLLETLEKKQIQISGLRFIETLPELKRFYTNILREYRGRSYAAMGNSNAWQGLDETFFVQFRKDRAAAGIRTRLLLSPDSRITSPKDKTLLREVKFVPKKYAFKSTIDIFDDKILIIGPNQTSLAVVIAVPDMVDIFKSTFELMWDLLPS
jgi:sugar-specific transcriptional regulator TrmB